MDHDSRAGEGATLSSFSVFAILYMGGFLCEMTDKWKHPGFTWFFLVLITALVFTRITRPKFLLFLVTSTAYVLLFRFPEVANHVNAIVLLNLSLIVGMLLSWRNPGSSGESYYREMLPLLRFALVLTYSLAGLHKFNWDFLDPNVSCVRGFLLNGFVPMLKGTVFGIPSAALVTASAALLGVVLGDEILRRLSRPTRRIVVVLIVGTIAASIGAVLGTADSIPPIVTRVVVTGMAVSVLCWEFVGGLLLMVPWMQGPIVLISVSMHAAFALIGFFDFGALAFALLFNFIPPNYLKLLLESNPTVKFRGIRVHRVHVYFAGLLLVTALAGIHYRVSPITGEMPFLAAFLLDASLVVLIWPILTTLVRRERPPWSGVPLFTRQVSPITAIAVAVIALHGLSPYFGLRTAGTFSMFSNLRTEGARSNHVLFPSNPFKVWDYQEDLVHVLEIDDTTAKVGHKYRKLRDSHLPVVEFRKLIHKWTRANMTVPITFEYSGRAITTSDIVNDPDWQTPERSWEMFLMDFRQVQPKGPNQCRW